MLSFIDFSTPQVQAAIINGFFSTIVTGIFGLISLIISSNFRKDAQKAERLEVKLQTAIDDIHFLLKVEELHCQRNKNNENQGYKNITRNMVRQSFSPLDFSGKFTPGKVNDRKYSD